MAETEEAKQTEEELMGEVFDRMENEDTEDTPEPSADAQDTNIDQEAGAEETSDAPIEETEPTDQSAETAPEPAQTPASDAPVSWSADAKTRWSGLDPAIQEEILKREGEIEKGLRESAERLKNDPITAALEPVARDLELRGMQPANYVSQLVAADRFLREKPIEAIQWLAGQYRIDLASLTSNAETDEYVDPQFAALQKELGELKSTFQQQAMTAQQQQAQSDQAKIAAFAADPKHMHFETVRAEMGALLNSGRASDMESAYEMAVWANPDTRATLIAEHRASEEAERKKDAEARAAQARRAKATNVSSKATANGATPKAQTMEEELGEVWDRMQGA